MRTAKTLTAAIPYYLPDEWADRLLTAGEYLIKLAAVVLLWLVASALIKRLIKRLAMTWRHAGYGKRADTLAGVLMSVSRYLIGFVGLCGVLGVFDIPIASVLAVAGIGSVAVGFGAQSLVKDVITGFFILFEGQFSVGDIVTIADKTGTVEAIGMRTTRIRGFDGDVYILPNSQITVVTNQSANIRRAVVDIHLHDGQAVGLIYNEMEAQAGRFASEPVVLVMGEPANGDVRIIAECAAGKREDTARILSGILSDRLDQAGVSYSFKQ